MLQFI